MISYSNAEEALVFWDMVDDDANIFVPVILSKESEANAIYVESFKNVDKIPTNLLRVFINRDEANSYKLSRQSNKVTIAKTTVGYLTKSLIRNWGNRSDKRIDCVLSTIDIDGKMCSIETLWSNILKLN